jgi:hypothetical protein
MIKKHVISKEACLDRFLPHSIIPIFIAWLLAGLLLAMLAGCAAREYGVADLKSLPQSPSWYQERVPGADWEVKTGFQTGLSRVWRGHWFEPWLKPGSRAGWQLIKADGERFLDNTGYGETLLARRNPYYRALIDACLWEKYPNAGWNAITTQNSNLRLLPSAQPVFSSDKPGEGFPFDRLQQTSLPPNTPIYVHHFSKDRAWLLVHSPLAWGWLEAGKAARMTPAQTEQFMAQELLAITKDHSAVLDLNQRFLFKADLGVVLPLVGRNNGRWLALVASPDFRGRAVLQTAQVKEQSAAPFALPLSAKNIAKLADGIMGQNYGWGGLYGNRDCSAALRDLFAPFALWLPRNSYDQAHNGNLFINLEGMNASEKKGAIIKDGIPFRTLVWMQGHIMLYIGPWQGEPLVMHNIWGLRTNRGNGIIGRMVITTLEPGKERADLVKPEGLLINRVAGITLLTPETALRTSR